MINIRQYDIVGTKIILFYSFNILYTSVIKMLIVINVITYNKYIVKKKNRNLIYSHIYNKLSIK